MSKRTVNSKLILEKQNTVMFWQGNKSHHIRKHNVKMYDAVLLHHTLARALVFTTFSLLHSFCSSLLHARMQTTQKVASKAHLSTIPSKAPVSAAVRTHKTPHAQIQGEDACCLAISPQAALWAPSRARSGQFFCCHLNYDFLLYEVITVIVLYNYL